MSVAQSRRIKSSMPAENAVRKGVQANKEFTISLKVHKMEIFFGFDFIISLLVMSKH